MAVVGGGWRKLHFSAWGPSFLRYFSPTKPLPTSIFTQNPDGKITIKTVGSNNSLHPKKWRWLAVVGGNRVFSAFLKLLNLRYTIAVFLCLFAVRDVPKGIPNPDHRVL
jgi:hypothetical protein